ncbi:MAG: porin [Proteobacteria bacterium]|nr:porin [Pseudomonadota bacterium]HQR04173.1 porin [Rhodocyclaceae bacterium]
MQKKLIALALAGLSSAAFAQTNVTIYGVGDLSLESVKMDGTATSATDAPSKMRVANNSSYIGFKGTEDLGNGLKAVFQLETAVSFGTNADTLGGTGAHAPAAANFGAARDSYLGLAGDFGTVAIGTLTGPYRALGVLVTNAPGAASAAYTGAVTGTIGGVRTSSDDRTSNMVAYISPNFNGFQVTLGYAADANSNNAANNSLSGRTWTLGANYAAGGLTLGYAYLNSQDPQNAAAAALNGVAGPYNDKLTGHRLAAKYDFGQGTTLAGMYDRQKWEASNMMGAGYLQRNAWQIALAHRFGANTVGLEYARAAKLNSNAGDVPSSNLSQWSLQYTYDLSKRTMLKAYYTALTTGSAVGAGFYNNPVAGSGAFALNGDSRALGFGMRHSF